MTTNRVERLKEEVKSNPAANAVFCVWALRKRSRRTVTVHALQQTMREEGFKHTREEYVRVLNLLAQLKLGEIEHTKRGKVSALTHVQVPLQVIGTAAVSAPGLSPDAASPTTTAQKGLVFGLTAYSDQKKVFSVILPADIAGDELAKLVQHIRTYGK